MEAVLAVGIWLVAFIIWSVVFALCFYIIRTIIHGQRAKTMTEQQRLFNNPETHDRAIETTISNLLMAGVLRPCEVSACMMGLTRLDDLALATHLVASRLKLDDYYEFKAELSRN